MFFPFPLLNLLVYWKSSLSVLRINFLNSYFHIHLCINCSNLFFSFKVLTFVIDHLRIIRISPFANRLSFDAPPPVQRLRCLANYQALRFSDPISSLGETLVARMKKLSVNNSGKYISVHLRFEEVS